LPLLTFTNFKDIIRVHIVENTAANRHVFAFDFFVFFSFCDFICAKGEFDEVAEFYNRLP